jgi:protein-tyrosine phosphatase
MLSPLFVIDGPWRGRLAIAPAPAPEPYLEKNLRQWKNIGISAVVSLLRPGELEGMEAEEEICHEIGLKFYSIPITDHSVPAPDELPKIAEQLTKIEVLLRVGEKVAAHCYAGIGRSGIATISLLMLAGIPLEDARALVSSARGIPTPETEEQHEWLREFDRHRRLSYT